MEEEVEELWVCKACTFNNQASCKVCSMCHAMRRGFWWPFQQYRSFLSVCITLRFLGNILCLALAAGFALVGAFTGAIAGGLSGRAVPIGVLQGASLGAVAGAVLCVEVLEALRVYWNSEQPGPISSLSWSDIVDDLLTGRFVQDFIVPALSATQRWQLNISEMSYEDVYEMMIPGEVRVKGATEGMLQCLPMHVVTQTDRRDASGDVLCCTICLQELEQGDVARNLPACKHTFHLNCLDQWLAKHFICPVCRQYIRDEKSR